MSTEIYLVTSPDSQIYRPIISLMSSYYYPHALLARDDEHIEHTPLTSLSKLSPYSALTLSIVLVIISPIKRYTIEALLFKRLYGSKYAKLSEIHRRGLVSHHIAWVAKLVVLVAAV